MSRLTSSLRGGAALGAVMAVALGAGAQAKPAKHHKAAAGPTQTEQELKAQVEALQNQVQALESRLDAQSKAQQQTASQVQAAQAQAQAAQTQAAAAQQTASANQEQIQTIPSEVKTEVAKATPKPGWWGNTTVGAQIFSNVSGIQNFSNNVRQPDSGVDYDIKRFYLIVNHKFNDVFAANLTTDFIYDSGSSATQLIIKKAWLEAKLSDFFTIRAGANDMPWVPFVEKLYGYRFVENTLIDRTKFGTSTDWGLHVFGSLKDNLISYQVSIVDGNGFKKPATGTANQTDAVDIEGRVSASYAGFTAGVGGYSGYLGQDVVGGPPAINTARRFDAVVAYVNDRFRIAGEYFWAKDWTGVTQLNPALTNTSEGFSAYGAVNFTSQIALFGRYDYVRPQMDTAPNFHDNYFNVGIDYKPIKPLDLALVYKREKVQDGLFSTTNGTIGGSDYGTYDEIGVFTQLNF